MKHALTQSIKEALRKSITTKDLSFDSAKMDSVDFTVERPAQEEHGDFSLLRLMDNNIIASKNLKQIVDDLLELAQGKGHPQNQNIPKVNKL